MLGRSCALRATDSGMAHSGVAPSLGMRENLQSLAPDASLHPFRRVEPSWPNTVTAALSKSTLHPLSQSLPIPNRLCWKEGMIFALRMESSRWMSAWAEDAWRLPPASPTKTLAAAVFMLATGAWGVR